MPAVNPELPPRHSSSKALCMRAILKGDCSYHHDYHLGEMTPEEKRWLYVELMLEELAALEPKPEAPAPAGDSFEVDDVIRAEDGLIATIMGTRTTWSNHAVPYVLDTHPYILGDV